jgi:hypothetical protein
MKTYRVTLTYRRDGHTSSLSTTVPACNDIDAINKVIGAHSLVGQVIAPKAEEIND